MSNERKDWEEDLKRHLYIQIGGFYGLPKGWVKFFLPSLIDDLFNILGGYAEDWIVLQVKEKFNEFASNHKYRSFYQTSNYGWDEDVL